jgi:hypothetical protein
MKIIRKAIRRIKKLYYISAFTKFAISQIEQIKIQNNSPYKKSPQKGYMRGIDYYPERELIRILTLLMVQYRKVHGEFPDLVSPTGFNEKILWSKFFAEVKIPESGNKLLTSTFIPEDLGGALQCPEIHWRSARPRLPRNHEIKPGTYYVKATHGSGMFQRVRYPMDEKAIARLERKCRKWLESPYGLEKGEWWYNVFDREIILDEDVAGDSRSIAYDFSVFRGKVEHITMHRKGDAKQGELDELTRFDADFQPLPPSQQSFRPPVSPQPIAEETKRQMKHFASRIGGDKPFVRVDFVLGRNGRIFLIELTFSPANGLAKRPAELERWLGSKWTL